jgi:glucan 1,3-beta-glucosidase
MHLFTNAHAFSFDNSGHRVSSPAWQTSSSNVQRTDNVIKQIAGEFASQVDVVSIIAPLNECVLFFISDVASKIDG